MRNILIEQAQYLVNTDEIEPLEYLKILNEINSLSEEELLEIAELDLLEALEEGEITDEEFDLMIDEYAQDLGDDAGMQECDKIKEDYGEQDLGKEDNKEMQEDLEVDEGLVGNTAKFLVKQAGFHST